MSISLFGEVMLRLTPAMHANKIYSSEAFNTNYAGAESNVASALTRLGNTANFISKLPDNALGDAAIRSLSSYGINTQHVRRGGERIGIYFIEAGSSIRPSNVIYDRAHSAISAISENEFDWPALLEGQSWLHLSGITPALSAQCAAETAKAAELARSLGVKVSFDMNFRRTLWPDVDHARAIFSSIIEYSNLVHGNLGVLKDVFGFEYHSGSTLENTLLAAQDIQKLFGIERVAFTVRDHHSASVNAVSGVFSDTGGCKYSSTYTVDVLDRFGSGDAYAAGILHGIEQQWDSQKIVDFATAAFSLKHTILGDQHTSTADEILAVVNGNTSGHVIR